MTAAFTQAPQTELTQAELLAYTEQAKSDAIHAFETLRVNGTLSASLTFHITHRVAETDHLLHIRFPGGLARDQSPKVTITSFKEAENSILQETRLNADTAIHVHTAWLSAWSLAHKSFPILYVAAARHLLAREIPNHLDRTRSIRDVIAERLDTHPELAPVPALLESNGGVNFWGKGILKTSELILFVEEGARFQAIAEQVGGAKVYTPGALELQWKRTGLLEKSAAYTG